MARKINVEYVDDLDGTVLGDNPRTVNFAVDGVEYSMDLSEKNAEKFLEQLQPYIDVAQRVGKIRGGGARGRTARDRSVDVKAVRVWARDNGFEVSSRGRVPAHVMQAFAEAH